MAKDLPTASSYSNSFTGILPLALAREIKDGVKEFLHTSFKPSTPAFKNLITDFTSDPDNVFRGPYIGVDLPFSTSATDEEFFLAVPLGHRPFLHQQRAFERLEGSVRNSTIVATGTGSGKTECFFLPILDWCRQNAGDPGIKAIIIYPMNALAEDQAKRLAAQIWHNPLLKGKVRAGIYADQEPQNPASVMQQDDIIRAREVMHRNPPDILLTNYKMLDNLLIRPNRKRLWEKNSPETLQYLVVDELHTFDGAQGTDLACLIRRLKTRLKTPSQTLCCVGTSATLGDQGETKSIVEYAEKLFDEAFTEDAVVTEDRVDMDTLLEHVQEESLQDLWPSPEKARNLAQWAYAREPLALIADLHEAWFGETKVAEIEEEIWRAQLGERIGQHAFLLHLLAALDPSLLSLDDLALRIQKSVLPNWTLADIEDLLGGFITLIAYAKRHVGGEDYLPFLTVRVHFWIRELNRMVVSIPSCNFLGNADAVEESPASAPRLFHSRDLSADHPESVLPVVHCRECSSIAWITLETLQGDGFTPDLNSIYQAYFSSHPSSRLTYLLPQPPASGILGGVQHVEGHVCQKCLHWHLQPNPPAHCHACGGRSLYKVWRSQPKWSMTGSGLQSQKSARCAYCGSSTGTGIFGVSATSIASTLVSLLFASKANGDPKLLAFGDSVQDVAHRAGFIEARSYRTLLRQTIAHWLTSQTERDTFEYFYVNLAADTLQHYASPAEFAGAMAHVDLLWLKTISNLFESASGNSFSNNLAVEDTDTPISPDDLEAVQRRLAWESFSEMTFRSQFGRTLENAGCLSLSLDIALLGRVAQEMKTETAERLGTLFEVADATQFLHFLLGILHRMLHDGAVRIDKENIDPIGTLAQNNANWVGLVRSRRGAYSYPSYGRQARKPLLPILQSNDGFSSLTDAGSSARWYAVWARKSFAGGEVLRKDFLTDFYLLTFRLLTEHGLTEEMVGHRRTTVWVIKPDAVKVSSDAACLECGRCLRRIHVHPDQLLHWIGMRCLNPSCSTGHLQEATHVDVAPILKEQLLHGHLRRVNARDHTSMLEADRRRRIEKQFIAGGHSWYPNMLSTTPTLELGVDIGDLSSVLLYSVPPSQANYVQRLGRAGRREGNALGLTIVGSQPHDLYFWEDPPEMIQGAVSTPGLYLDAYAILRRQFSAFALERLITDTGRETRFGLVRSALEALDLNNESVFPFDWINFVERQGDTLLADFRGMFDLPAHEGLSSRLSEFIQATDPEESFRSLILNCLRQVETESEQWQRRIRQLDQTIRNMRNTHPAPKDLEEQIRNLEQDRRVYRAINRNVQRQDVLELLTNFGILPNYAFPAEGVKLRSVTSSRDEAGQWQDRPSEYVRAASSGLTEFAPGSSFYAEGHRIPINEIDLRISEPEDWRFCPACPHLERESDTVANACPRCKSVQWRDVGQVKKMVRLKQVHAVSSSRDTRIGDDQEERTIVSYARELYPSFENLEARSSHLIPTLPQPFGFEFLAHVEFRDVNFGRRAENDLMEVAGQDVQAEGFLLCAQCGHVLSPKTRIEQTTGNAIGLSRQPAWKEEHARHCPVLRQTDDTDHRIHTFLYSDFRSEAVRIRLPILSANETEIQSFTAALQLGMQLSFEGKVDHLRSVNLSLEEGRGTTHWLFLYDSVPGGTGYLEQLVRPDTFYLVLNQALQTMQECVCNQDQEQDEEMRKDGCYRCLFGYRNRMRMPEISRDTAIRMIREVLSVWPDLQTQDSIGDVDISQIEESELELRFVSWLQEKVQGAGGQFQSAPVQQGKHGYLIRMDDITWEIEPQVNLDSRYSVTEPARADFLLRQTSGPDDMSKPIALFLDGWKYHQDRVATDVRQRMSIRDSGRLWVWSLTWEDLETEAQTKTQTRWDPFSALDATDLPSLSNETRDLLFTIRRSTSAELLFHFLRHTQSETWTAVAGQLSLLVLKHCPIQTEELLDRIDNIHPIARAYSDGLPVRSHFGLAVHEETFLAIGADDEDLNPMYDFGLRPFIYLHESQRDERQRRFQWAGALRLFNLLQFLPKTYWLCSTETDPVGFPLAPPRIPVVRDEWDDSMLFLNGRARASALHLRQAGIQAPEVGWDILLKGQVVTQLEMAWPNIKVGVLMEDLPDSLRQSLLNGGWSLFPLSEIDTDREGILVALRQEEVA